MDKRNFKKYIPILDWGSRYSKEEFANDFVASSVVIILLVPQSLAYALLAGLPPEAGIYASIVPIVLYAIFGSSKVLAVGPVAVVSLLTASTIGQVAEQGTAGYAVAALTLALLSGGFLILLGVLRLGFLANFLSHPVISGFITASGILIATSQLKHIFGIDAHGHTLPDMVAALLSDVTHTNWITALLGISAIAFLFWVRRHFKPLLLSTGLNSQLADIIARAGPVFAIIATTVAVWAFGLEDRGVQIVGNVPQGLPPFTMPDLSIDLINALVIPAILISIIGFVESVSVASTLAAKKRQRIDPNQELLGLGAANVGAAFTGGFPVTGGFARSVVNFDAGAATPAAGIFTAIGLALAAMFLTPLIYFLPKATLAATIIIAVTSLINFSVIKSSYGFSKPDFFAVTTTILATLLLGVEIGVMAGVLLSLALFLYKTTKPHIAEVGLVEGTEHFRNILRHEVQTDKEILTLRVDEQLYFGNSAFMQTAVLNRIKETPELEHLILMCSAVNDIDLSALEMLEELNDRLKDMNITMHLSEVKGPVTDKPYKTDFFNHLSGNLYLSQYQAFQENKKRNANFMSKHD